MNMKNEEINYSPDMGVFKFLLESYLQNTLIKTH